MNIATITWKRDVDAKLAKGIKIETERVLTVTIAETMVSITFAMADMIELMARPMAEKMEP